MSHIPSQKYQGVAFLKCLDCGDQFDVPQSMWDRFQAYQALDIDPRYKRPFASGIECPNDGTALKLITPS